MLFANSLVIVRGGGDLATGAVYRLHKAGFPVIVLELAQPLVVRRQVALATAVPDGQIQVEDLRGKLAHTMDEALVLAQSGTIPVLVAPRLPSGPRSLKVIVDARMAKRNIDTLREQAPLVIALGPGFTAGVDCHVVIETMRGHRLGRVIWQGEAMANTGTPGLVAGRGAERVLRAPAAGMIIWEHQIGDTVTEGDLIGAVVGPDVQIGIHAPFAGVLRGLIAPETRVEKGLKVGDLDARGDSSACFTISDKALAIGGGVLEAILTWMNAAT
jgi:xanthine dehydrogenase accessory factor